MLIGTVEKHLTWLPRALIKAAREEVSHEVEEGHGAEPPTITLLQPIQGKGKALMAKSQLLNDLVSSLHSLIQQLPLIHMDHPGSRWSVTSPQDQNIDL